MPEKSQVIARLTVTHRNGQQTIVEVHDDASFSRFYRWYKRNAGQDDKHYMRSMSRIEARDLEALGAQIKENWKRLAAHPVARGKWSSHLVDDVKIVLLDAERYIHFLDCDPEQLPGGGLPRSLTVGHKPIGAVIIPIGYTPLQKRMDIITGRT